MTRIQFFTGRRPETHECTRYRRVVEPKHVATIEFFRGLPENELDAVAQTASEIEFAQGDALAREGDFGHALFVLDSGTAQVTIRGRRIRDVGPGDVVGEVAVLASGRRTASVVATTPVRASAWFKRDVWTLEKTAPEAARRLRAALASHMAADGE
jgi:CRP-like cAMP-binding protein